MTRARASTHRTIVVYNPHVDYARVKVFSSDSCKYFAAHASDYYPSPLVSLPRIAHSIGLRSLYAKVESSRFGLNSFKSLGVKWALESYRRERPAEPITELVTATDGNHGRAVARIARAEGLSATIFLPRQASQQVLEALSMDGAVVVVVQGNYDDSVDAAFEYASQHRDRKLLLSDTSADPTDRIAEWIIQGYETIFAELNEQIQSIDLDAPDLFSMQIGIGGLAAAAIRYVRSGSASPVQVVGVEPHDAAAALQSVRRGDLVKVAASSHTVMAGLNAGLLSAVAWPDLEYGLDQTISIDDDYCTDALAALASSSIDAGPTGAAGLAGLLALADSDSRDELIGRRALIVVTEGRHG